MHAIHNIPYYTALLYTTLAYVLPSVEIVEIVAREEHKMDTDRQTTTQRGWLAT